MTHDHATGCDECDECEESLIVWAEDLQREPERTSYRWTGLRFCAFWIAAFAGCIGVWWLLIDAVLYNICGVL